MNNRGRVNWLGLVLVLFTMVPWLSGCATVYNPVTGKSESTLYSSQDELSMGKAVDAQIKKEYKTSQDPALLSRIKTIGDRVAVNAGRSDIPFTFQVLETDQVNAFAGPGGYVYVTTGLLKLVGSDDELACVLGHEIGHVAARHAVKQLQSQVFYSLSASIIFSEERYAEIEKAVNLAFNLRQLSYSRKDELQADELGMQYGLKSGYKPEGMLSFLKKLAEIEKKQPRLIIVPLSTHPVSSVRIENATAWIESKRRSA